MNYLKVYFKLMQKAEIRGLVPQDQYSENHHVFPVSIFGKNDVLVNLTYKEHVVAHHLLYKHYYKVLGPKHEYTKKMGIAVRAFFMNAGTLEKPLIRKLVNRVRTPMSEETKKKLSDLNSGSNNPNFGRKGKDHWHYGKSWSEEHKRKISQAGKGRKLSQESIEKIRLSNIKAKEAKAKKYTWINTLLNKFEENKSIMYMSRTYNINPKHLRNCVNHNKCHKTDWVIKSQDEHSS